MYTHPRAHPDAQRKQKQTWKHTWPLRLTHETHTAHIHAPRTHTDHQNIANMRARMHTQPDTHTHTCACTRDLLEKTKHHGKYTHAGIKQMHHRGTHTHADCTHADHEARNTWYRDAQTSPTPHTNTYTYIHNTGTLTYAHAYAHSQAHPDVCEQAAQTD